ncbi:MAG: MarR family winged helix-turn-helix transcriptional regulator [Acidimicrobiales bacterium]
MEGEPLGRALGLTAKAMRERFDQQLAAVGSSLVSWLILRAASDNPGISQRQLAALLGIEGPTLTHHLDRVAADGLVDRARHPADRRVMTVSLTAAGKHHLGRVTAHAERLDAELRSLLSERELRTTLRVLNRLRDHYTKETDAQHPGH